VLALVAVLIGGLVEIIPMFLVKSNIPTIASVKPYTPLECRAATSTSAKAAWAATRR
jgi:cbb3-type cytochrome oxidase cytochrome c subunit